MSLIFVLTMWKVKNENHFHQLQTKCFLVGESKPSQNKKKNKLFESGALPVNMLPVRTIENNKIYAYFKSD